MPWNRVRTHQPVRVHYVTQGRLHITMEIPYLLRSKPAEVCLNWIPRTARSSVPFALGPVFAGIRNDDFHVCARLSNDLELMGNGSTMEHFLTPFAAMPQCF